MNDSLQMQSLSPREELMKRRNNTAPQQFIQTAAAAPATIPAQPSREELLKRAHALLAQQQAQAASPAQLPIMQSQTAQVSMQPEVAQPTMAQPQSVQPTVGQLQPTAAQSQIIQPVIPQTQVIQSSTAQPQVMQPAMVESVISQLMMAQPTTDKLKVTQPIMPQAQVVQSSTSQPHVLPLIPANNEANVRLQELQNTLASKPQNGGKKLGKTLFNSLFYLMIIVMIGAGVLFALSKDPGKSYLGYRLYNVKTASMTPKADGSSPKGGFRAGDTILVEMVQPESIQVGDIITYAPGDDPNVYLTHRVVEVMDHYNEYEGVSFITKGDANDSNDAPITGDMVIGKKVYSLPRTGVALQFIRENLLTSALTIALAIGAILLFRMYFAQFGKQKGQELTPQAQYTYA
jgi:signal peptidase I